MKKYLGIDFGSRYIGFAIGSPASVAVPLETRANDGLVWDYISSVSRRENVAGIVVGIPRTLAGRVTSSTELTVAFIDRLQRRVGVPVYREDERLSSRAVSNAGLGKRSLRGPLRHAHEAAEILQSFLDRHAGD